MKKTIICLMMFLLCACTSNAVDPDYTETNIEKNEYIEPVSDLNIFEFLNEDIKDFLYKANNNEDVDVSVLKNLGKELKDISLYDYNGNEVNLSEYKDKKLVIEVVASWCSHCKEQALNYSDDLLTSLGDDVTFIQYFANGDESNIDGFYSELGIDVPSSMIVCVNDEETTNEFVNYYNLELTPSFYFFDNGILTWETTGTLDSNKYLLFKDIAFNKALDLNTLTDSDGKDILSYIRDEDDIKQDLSSSNYAKLENLDNDKDTINLTIKYIGKDIEYNSQLSNESSFTSEVNFIDYANKELIIILIDELNNDYINLINEFTSNNKDINVVVLNISDENNKEIANKIDAKVVSIMNQVPEILNDISFVNYPSALFIKEGIITGAYSNIESSDKLLEAYNTFLTDNSIALLTNN